MMNLDWLSILIFFPTLGAVLLAFVPSSRHDTIKGVALIISVITMLLSFLVYSLFDPLGNGMQHQINIPWVASLGIDYHLGIDGISLLLIVLTTILTVLCVLSSWRSVTKSVKGYFISMLLLTTGMVGVFCALD
ncbi:MAG: Fe-S-binding domain-containing protein, partial [candidate division Zixibacteria bacterium]